MFISQCITQTDVLFEIFIFIVWFWFSDIVQSHEEKISESLDSALMKTLGGASFTRRDQSLKESVARNKASLPCKSSLVENLGKQAKLGGLKFDDKIRIKKLGFGDEMRSSSPLFILYFQRVGRE